MRRSPRRSLKKGVAASACRTKWLSHRFACVSVSPTPCGAAAVLTASVCRRTVTSTLSRRASQEKSCDSWKIAAWARPGSLAGQLAGSTRSRMWTSAFFFSGNILFLTVVGTN